jgi:hypothetical protein
MHDLHAEVPAATRGHRPQVETATIVADLQGPSVVRELGDDRDGRRTGMLADIL